MDEEQNASGEIGQGYADELRSSEGSPGDAQFDRSPEELLSVVSQMRDSRKLLMISLPLLITVVISALNLQFSSSALMRSNTRLKSARNVTRLMRHR
jgi:hypothetical protein